MDLETERDKKHMGILDYKGAVRLSPPPPARFHLPPLSQLLKVVPLAVDQACKCMSLYGMHISCLKKNKILSLHERRRRDLDREIQIRSGEGCSPVLSCSFKDPVSSVT